MVKKAPPSHISEPVHVLLGISPAGCLKVCGGRECVVLQDPLYLGPCDVLPAHHHRKRQFFWRHLMEATESDLGSRNRFAQAADQLLSGKDFIAKLVAYPPDRPVVLWTTPSLPDRLAFWWVLDSVKRARLGRGRFWVAEPRLPEENTGPDYYSPPTLGQCSPRRIAAAFSELRPLDAGMVLAGAALWRHFVDSSPEGFDQVRRRGSSEFPDLRLIAEAYGSFFPQVSGRRQPTVKLSRVDQLLLDTLEVGEWLRPVDVFRKDFRTLELFLPCDLFFIRRLREWAWHSPSEPVLVVRREPKGINYYTDVAYQLTPHGDRLRRQGLRRPDEAPSMFVGGCCLYGGRPTWVRRNRGRHWSIEGLNL